MPTLTREELYEMVWKDAIRTVAPTLGVSDVWLKKCCVAADIPVPDRAYWNKLHAGKPTIVRKLTPRPPGVPGVITFGPEPRRSSWPYKPEVELAEPKPVEPHFAEPIEDVEARVTKAVGKVRLHRDLESVHPRIRHVLEEDEKRRTKPKGIPYRLQYSDPLFDSPFEQRRLRLLNSVLLALTTAGYKCWLYDEDARSSGVVIGSQKVSFLLDHPTAKRDHEHRYRTRKGPVDILQFKLGATGRVWIDKPGDKLEGHLSEIVVQTIVGGEAQLRSSSTWAYEKALEHRKEMEELLRKTREEADQRARARRIKAEQDRRNGLLRMARDLRKANDIRGLVEEVVKAKCADPQEVERVRKWSIWARAVADRTDPLMRLTFDDDGRASLIDIELPPTSD